MSPTLIIIIVVGIVPMAHITTIIPTVDQYKLGWKYFCNHSQCRKFFLPQFAWKPLNHPVQTCICWSCILAVKMSEFVGRACGILTIKGFCNKCILLACCVQTLSSLYYRILTSFLCLSVWRNSCSEPWAISVWTISCQNVTVGDKKRSWYNNTESLLEKLLSIVHADISCRCLW